MNFTEGDRIGVTVSLSSGDYAANRLMTYDGLFFSAAGLVWYDEAQGASTFTAYYPYRDEGVPGTLPSQPISATDALRPTCWVP